MINPIDLHVNQFLKGFRLSDQGGHEDPTVLGWKFLFDFNPQMDYAEGGTTSSLFAAADSRELDSAERYLKSIGHPQKAKMVVEFKKMLQYTNQVTPWYFQSIEGVNELWKIDMKEFDPYRGKEKYLTINCLESIDLRITAMADLYRKFTFDYKFMRELLPHNLRQFTMYIMVGEIRKFQTFKKKTDIESIDTQANINNGNFTQTVGNAVINGNGQGNNVDSHSIKDLDDLISIMMFKCGKCEFDFNESYPTEIINMGGEGAEMSKQKFKIKVGKISEENTYSILDLLLKDGSDTYNKIGKGLNGSLDPNNEQTPISKNLGSAFNPTNPLQQKLDRAVNGLGENVFGTAKDTLLTANVAGFVDRPISNLLKSVFGDQVLGNAYNNGQVTNNINKLGNEDVYPESPGKDLGAPFRDYPRADQ